MRRGEVFTETISATFVAANGDELFEHSTGTGSYTTDASGVVTSVSPVTTVFTIDVAPAVSPMPPGR